MVPLTMLAARLRADLNDWLAMSIGDLVFGHRSTAFTVVMVLFGSTVLALVARAIIGRRPGRDYIAVPALLAWSRRSPLAVVRHAPLLFLLAGMPFFVLALADPHATIAEQQVSYPGRRIALLIDASSSMLKPFGATRLSTGAPNDATFFTTVAAAETFIRNRRSGTYRDLIALIEFGDEAYVITPFTTDYDNVLLSTSLIGDWSEFMRFPNQGTKIAAAIDQGTNLFRAFDFVSASGNLMVIFSDGEDTQVTLHGRHVDDILVEAVATKIPVYLIRTNRDKRLGEVVPDNIWKPAVEATGGRFYPAANENDVLRAIADIDQRSPGTIEMKQYSMNEVRFAPFALLATALWSIGLALMLAFPQCRTFP